MATIERRSTWATPLPDDLVDQTGARVQVVAVVFGSLWALAILVNPLLGSVLGTGAPRIPHWPVPSALVMGSGILSSAFLVVLVSTVRLRPGTLLGIGLGYQALTALLVALLHQWDPAFGSMRLSWVCLVVLMYPAIVPNTLRMTFAGAFIAASMDPVALGVTVWRTGALPDAVVPYGWAWTFLPTFLCVPLAVLPAHVYRIVGRQFRQARKLGSYQLGQPIGEGSMGQVYRAQHRLLARPAAIKVIQPPRLAAATHIPKRVLVERFRREAEAAAVLRSPHTIELYDFGDAEDGTFYYVMELVDGVNFENLVERFGPVPAERAAFLGIQACASLAEAHLRGLMHRDIKPANIFAARLGLEVDFVKVLDFGLVKAMAGSQYEGVALTAPEVATGTPAFMAPEIARGGNGADHRIDIYSFGCVLYWLVTGQLVFEAPNAIVTMHKQISETPMAPSRRTELPIPPEFDELVLDCLAKDPNDRPADALVLSQRLAAIPFERPWSAERARQWWDANLPVSLDMDAPCDSGELVPTLTGS